MSAFLVVEPLPIVSVVASRGSGAGNLLSRDPKEVWIDGDSGSASVLTIDLGAARAIDTIFLGYLRQAAADAVWSITGGVNGSGEFQVQPATPLRVPDTSGDFALVSHALWYGAARTVRYIAISITQSAGNARLMAGALIIGAAFAPELGQEWGFGRRPIDLGTATPLPSGGFAVVEGARKRAISWTFGDLSIDEADRLERIAVALGETRPCLVIEDAARTSGLVARIHYGLFVRWQPFERRNRRQTRWEMGFEEWV